MFLNLARNAHGFGRLINLGSGAEYDRSQNLIKVKESQFGQSPPKDNYGRAKYFISEQIEKHKNMMSLRCFGVFGKHEDYTTRFISNAKALKDPWKRNKIENLAILLQGALAAEGMVGLKMNLEEKKLSKIMAVLPALKKPTISNLSVKGWIAIEVILEEKTVKRILPELKRAGAEGIIEYPLNKVIY